MTVAKSLFELQEIDIQLDKHNKAIALIDAQLKESKAVLAAKAELARRHKRLQELQTEQKTAELDVADAKTRVAAVETRLMSNEAGARELPTLQKESVNLKGRQKGLEEAAISLMERVEQAKKALDEQAAIVKTEEANWGELQKKLSLEKKEVHDRLPAVNAQRAEYAEEVPENAKSIYASIRSKKGGVAVSKVQGGICGGCRITLPTTLVQRARAGKEIVYCGNCGRIVYVP